MTDHSDERHTRQALQLAQSWLNSGANKSDALDTLIAVAISGSLELRGPLSTAAWLNALADSVAATAPCPKH